MRRMAPILLLFAAPATLNLLMLQPLGLAAGQELVSKLC